VRGAGRTSLFKRTERAPNGFHQEVITTCACYYSFYRERRNKRHASRKQNEGQSQDKVAARRLLQGEAGADEGVIGALFFT
jgi:hypothetical protein